ncbi:hypothetical protein [Nocardia exalbida]|nr:hypothetical protein [Nocardia exalbida]
MTQYAGNSIVMAHPSAILLCEGLESIYRPADDDSAVGLRQSWLHNDS